MASVNRFFAWACLICLLFPLLAAAEPPRGGTLRLALLNDPLTLDAVRTMMTDDLRLMPLVHQTLLRQVNLTNLVPGAASEWSASDDWRRFTFKLRPGVKFSNGREVVAEDYCFSLRRALQPSSGSFYADFLQGIRGAPAFTKGRSDAVAGLRAPAPDTLVIELEEPDLMFPYLLCWPMGVAVPEEEVRRLGARFSSQTVGCGPYRVREWKRGARLSLEPNPHYVGFEPRHLDGVEILIGGDQSTHLMMFERGELDIANITGQGIPLPGFNRLRKDPRWRDLIEFTHTMNTMSLAMNTEMAPFDNVLVRRAVNHAVNRDRWMRVATRHAERAEGVIPPSMPGYNPALRGYDYNPARARELLAASGLPLPLRSTLWHAADSEDAFLAQGVQADLKQVGIEIELKPVTFPQLIDAAGIRRTVPFHYSGWTVTIPDPSDLLGMLLDGRALNPPSINFSFYNHPGVNRLLDLGAAEIDFPKRFAIYQEAERIVVADAPWVFMGHRNIYGLRQRWLKGSLMEPQYWYRFDRVWIDRNGNGN